MQPHDETPGRLKVEVDLAHEAYRIAASRYNNILNDLPSGIPHPDGSARIRQAGDEMRRALAAYSQAVQRLSKFILSRGGSDTPS